jgi:hypothetical protein
MRKLSLMVVGALAIAAIPVATAQAKGTIDVTRCTGQLASGSYGRIVVPAGESCDGTAARINVSDGIRVYQGATFVLGEDGGTSTGSIQGGVHANAPASLQVHFARITDGVRMYGGGGNGQFSTVEDSVIRGDVTLRDYRGLWFGFIRNNVVGNVRLNHNVLSDPDANEYVTNTIRGNMICRNDSPAPQVGDSMGKPNVVTGRKVDQCANL